jgi:hypothetical protein
MWYLWTVNNKGNSWKILKSFWLHHKFYTFPTSFIRGTVFDSWPMSAFRMAADFSHSYDEINFNILCGMKLPFSF